MSNILSQNYKDAPAVSTELVKFLSINTSGEAVDTLIVQGKDLKLNMSELTKKFSMAAKEVGTAGNKLDKVTNEISGLKKRMNKVESKK